jgi:uncharacterized integral membrane protein
MNPVEGEAQSPVRQGGYKSAQAVVVALLVVGLLTGIFVFQNTTKAKVHFLFWSGSIPLAGALILAAVLGGILAFLVTFFRQRRLARDSRALLRRRQQEEEDLHSLDQKP